MDLDPNTLTLTLKLTLTQTLTLTRLDADEDDLLAELEGLEQDNLTDQLTSVNVASAPG